MLEIIGANGKISNVEEFLKKISIFSKKYNLTIQVFDASMIFGKTHLKSAVEHALRAMKRKTNSTNTLDKEILLYASGERQIKKAIPKMGVKKGCEKIALVLINDDEQDKENLFDSVKENILDQLNLKRDDSVLRGSHQTLLDFGLRDNEINTVTKDKYEFLILEKVAMVDVIK